MTYGYDLKVGDYVECKVKMQPLEIGTKGTVKEVKRNGQAHPIMVRFENMTVDLPMSRSEIKKV